MDNELRGRPGKLVPYDGKGPAIYFAWNEQITANLPDGPGERMQLSLNAEYDLAEQFRNWMLTTSPELCSKSPKTMQERLLKNHTSLAGQFDRFLITYAAEKFGPRLFLCKPVLERLLRWNDEIGSPSGHGNLKVFMAALLRGAKLRRGEGYGTVGPETKAGRKRLVSEFRFLRQKIKTASSRKNSAMTFQDVVSIIETHPDTFPITWKNTLSLRQFYRAEKGTTDGFIAGLIPPAEFVSQWLAWTLGRSPKKLNNMLGRFKK